MGCGSSKEEEEPPEELDELDIYSKYQFGDKLGSGGFGQVREVSVKASGEVRAVKIILKKELDEQSPVNVEEEIKIMKLFDHMNVVKLFEVYEDVIITYLVMEKLSGGELFDKLEREVVLTEKDAARIARMM